METLKRQFKRLSQNEQQMEPEDKHIHCKTTVQFPSNTTTMSLSTSGGLETGNKVWSDSSYDFSQDRDKFDFTRPDTTSPPESPDNYGQLTPREVRVSLHDEPVRQRSTATGFGDCWEEVVVSSSNASFKRKRSLMRTKTKSRLMDQQEIDQKQSRSGIQQVEEDDTFSDEDLPDEYKKLSYNRWTLLQLISFILIVGTLVCTLAAPRFRQKSLFDLQWWKWEVMMLILICGSLVSSWAIRGLVFFIERSILLRKRVLYFIYGLKKSVENCVWLALLLVAWHCIFDKKVEKTRYGKKVLPYVTKIWICLLIGTVVWLFKTLLIKVVASSFHMSTFFDRIQESLFNQYVIEKLSGPPVVEIQQDDKVGKFQNIDGGNGITIDLLYWLNQKNISAWNMKRLMQIVRTRVLTTLDEDTTVQITSENQAKVAANKIFCSVAKPASKHIYLEDLMRFMRNDEALKTIRFFDEESETKGISKRALKSWVVNVFRERRALALSLNDTKSAVNKLHQMMNVVVGIIIIVIWLLILKVATTQFFIFLSSQLLLVVFVFGNTCKTTFEAIVFLFVMHPFDVGDRCEVDGVQMIVEEMNILTTIFLRYDNLKIAYPNSVLSTMPIANYHRSPDMGDAIDFCIHMSTSTQKIAKMKERITRYIENKRDHWYPDPMIVVRDVEDLNRLKISIWITHQMNFQDMRERWKRRALLVEEMIKVFKDLDIEYRMLPVDINVRNMPALASNRLPSTWTTYTN